MSRDVSYPVLKD